MTAHLQTPDATADVLPAVEIRVHGVSGTSPEDLLDRPLVRQVAGDKRAGFFRPRLPNEAFSVPRGRSAASRERQRWPLLEGFAWGGLTSGAATRALWLLLLPFALMNVAPRMIPSGGAGGWSAISVIATWFCRMISLGLTVLITMGACLISMVAFGGQCGVGWPTTGHCPIGFETAGRWFGPEFDVQRLTGVTFLPVLAVLLIWAIAGRTQTKKANDDRRAVRGWQQERTLEDGQFWQQQIGEQRLRAVHLQAAFITMPMAFAAAVPTSAWSMSIRVLGALALLWWGWLLARRELFERAAGGIAVHYQRLGWVPVVLAVALCLWVGLKVQPELGSVADVSARLGDMLAWNYAVIFTLLAVLLMLLIQLNRQRRRRDGHGPKFWHRNLAVDPPPVVAGTAAALMAGLACLLASLFTSGVTGLLTVWFSRDAGVPSLHDIQVGYGAIKTDGPVLVANQVQSGGVHVVIFTALLLLSLVVLALCFAYRLVSCARTSDDQCLAEDYWQGVRESVPDDARRRAIWRKYWIARRTDYAIPFLWLLVILGVLVAAIAPVVAFGGLPFNSITSTTDMNTGVGIPARWWAAFGAWLTQWLLLGLVALGYSAFRVKATRRGVGIVWDVTCFWPRTNHPFAPPCYAERAVPDLIHRMRWYAGTENDLRAQPRAERIILSGHSQGSVLLFSALQQSEATELTRVGFVTHGAVLRRLYGRCFPGYFGPEQFQDTFNKLRNPDGVIRWINLWRNSDPLGGRIQYTVDRDRRLPGVDNRLQDPQWHPRSGDTAYPVAGGHSKFAYDPRFAYHGGILQALIKPGTDVPDEAAALAHLWTHGVAVDPKSGIGWHNHPESIDLANNFEDLIQDELIDPVTALGPINR